MVVWIASPLVVRHFAKNPLNEMGVSLSDDSSVRFNPFTSTLTVSELTLLDVNKSQALSVEYAEISVHLHRLLLKELYVSKFLLSGTEVKIVKDKQNLIVAGVDLTARSEAEQELPKVEQKSDEPPLDYTVVIPELRLQKILFDANIDGTSQRVLLNQLAVTDSSLSMLKQQLSLSMDALVNKAPMMLTSDVSLQGGTGSIDSAFSLEKFDTETLSPLLTDLGVSISGAFSANGNPKVNIGEENIAVTSEQIVVSVAALNLNYAPWIVEGASDVVTIDNLNITALPSGDVQQLSATVGTRLKQGNIGLKSHDNSVANWEDISLSTDLQLVDMQPNIVIERVQVNGLNLSENRQIAESLPMLSVGQLAVSDVQFSDNHLKIDTISMAGLKTDIRVNPDKSIHGLVDTTALTSVPQDEATAPEDVAEPEQTPGLTLELGKFLLADAAFVHINDQSVSPAYEHKITIEKLQAGPFDSTNSELESPFELLATDEGYLKIDAKGHVMLFADKLNALVNANVSELNLPAVSPYVKDGLGFEMKSGQLDVDIEVVVKDDAIDGKTKLFMRGIDMSSADEVEQGTIKEGKAMPLNVALGMLKDDQGNIDLGVPLRGNVSEPSFGVESFLGLVLKKAAMSQAKSYLMNTFVPYASVVSVAITGAEYLLKVRFEPLIFQTGEVGLTEENQQYLSELVLFMNDKPKLQLKTCAIGTYADLSLAAETVLNSDQKASLKAMGSKRQDNLKRYLIEQGIASSRILFCAPELDTAADAQARIELKTD
ncbi:DUF748 domain-containing protein [uncultured Paraglaciecola sp.]|uniref:DUF748 domain-containing protein n=1 Tax=uncultured Paraglaciecola sp. TaxID=1765024 RepID=UPI002605D33F|nr:DUF748 domain-containing protein [uncultured Paraglaciecola sp.]